MPPTIDPKLVSKTFHDLPTPEPESPIQRRRPHRFSTLCATVENPDQKDQYGSSSVPIYQTATFKGVNGEYDYSRSGNPTRSHLEHHIAKISSATHAFAVSSGMAALDVILRVLKPGEEIITGDDLYGGTNRLLTYIRVHGGVTVHHVDTTNADSLLPFLNPTKTAMVLLESPTNPLLKICDLERICKDVKAIAPNAIVVVDNTMMSPYLQRPLEHGCDIVYDSATKYLSGHHDLMAGVITCNRDDLAKKLAFTINSVGNALTPNDAFLLLRGIKTLAVRMDRQQTNAQAVAIYLDSLGFKVHYPGLASHPNADIHHRLADGNGAVLSFETGNKELSEKIVGATRLWGISVSFGCVNSLISMPCVMSHASIDAATRAERGLPEDLIRLCVGIEDSSDLLEDLEFALLGAGAIAFNALEGKHVRVPAKLQGLTEAVTKLQHGLPEEPTEWFISAPGKVILFGEHAVVHGVTAIAASVDLRCYGLTTIKHDGKLSVHFQDLDDFRHSWDVDALPWSIVSYAAEAHPEELDQTLIDAITSGPLSQVPEANKSARAASLALLYLYLSLGSKDKTSRPAFHFQARATLPVGAGLGSSASFSACIATALLLLHKHIKVPPLPKPNSAEHVHVSHQGRRAIPPTTAERVNQWAFLSEKVLHGNPSGVDNSVAVFGGALSYTRAGFQVESGMKSIQGFKSLRFLLTNSKIPRDTKKLVAGVGQKKVDEPEVVAKLLAAIQSISDEARRALADPEMSRDVLLSSLESLIRENHAHLVSLGVSHPALEQIRELTKSSPYSLSTKLTGAGGGGCAVTLVPDDFAEDLLKKLVDDLSAAKFDPYLTAVGGSGLGILSPYSQHRQKKALSPPATPTPSDGSDAEEAENETEKPLQTLFESNDVLGLPQWAESLGRWLYV